MPETMSFDLDDTGKIDLSAIYDRPDPCSYYQTLLGLDYQIPEVAAPLFRSVIDARRKSFGNEKTKILDVGSSYGVNSLILRHGVKMSNLFHLYCGATTKGLSRSELVARDRRLFTDLRVDKELEFVGLDVAGEALDYAEEVGVIDAGVTANLELRPPGIETKEQLSKIDIVISTGAIGYVGVPTFSRILDCSGTSPWLALLALRMFPVDEITAMLQSRGYKVYRQRGSTYRQRRFAGDDERNEVFSRLDALGIDPTGKEADGWYHADFYFAWREDEKTPLPIEGLSPA